MTLISDIHATDTRRPPAPREGSTASSPSSTSAATRIDADQPLVTVVVCTFNGGALLADAVRSVVRQTYANLEVLVIDDGSDDGSVEQARAAVDDPRVRWIRQERAGKAAALNRALREMRGEFYALQDADDESYPTRIERQVRYMLRRPELAATFCGYDLIDGGRRIAPNFRFKPAHECKRVIDAFHMPGHDPTSMWRVSLVRDFRYEESLRIGIGYDYMLQVGERYPMVVIGELLYSYRIDTAGLTRRDPARRLQFVKLVQRRARERRGLPTEPLDANPAFRPGRKFRPKDRDNNLAARFVDSVVSLRLAGRRGAALATGLRCARLHPFDRYYLKALAFALAPMRAIRTRIPPESWLAARCVGTRAADDLIL